jgi:hypothetical protein
MRDGGREVLGDGFGVREGTRAPIAYVGYRRRQQPELRWTGAVDIRDPLVELGGTLLADQGHESLCPSRQRPAHCCVGTD